MVINFTIDEDLFKQLVQDAKTQKRSRSGLIHYIISEYYKNKEQTNESNNQKKQF
jgi:metal-responsive CopG/Arc/MetJ family transcriptional regulator